MLLMARGLRGSNGFPRIFIINFLIRDNPWIKVFLGTLVHFRSLLTLVSTVYSTMILISDKLNENTYCFNYTFY